MNSESSIPAVQVARGALMQILASFPIACFTGALLTDIVYANSADMMWADFSAWLLAGGEIVGGLAAIVAFVILVRRSRAQGRALPWLAIGASVLVLVLAFLDNLVHSRDAWTSVVPTGLTLSAITVAAMLVAVWCGVAAAGRLAATRRYVGVRS